MFNAVWVLTIYVAFHDSQCNETATCSLPQNVYSSRLLVVSVYMLQYQHTVGASVMIHPPSHTHTHTHAHTHSSSEIPQFRLPYDVVSFEVELMKDLGVKVCSLTNPASSIHGVHSRYTYSLHGVTTERSMLRTTCTFLKSLCIDTDT